MTLWCPNYEAHRTTGREDELPFPSVQITEIYDPHPEFSIEAGRPPPTLEEMKWVIALLLEFMSREDLHEILETMADIISPFQTSYLEPPALPPVVSSTEAVYGDIVESPPFVINLDEG